MPSEEPTPTPTPAPTPTPTTFFTSLLYVVPPAPSDEPTPTSSDAPSPTRISEPFPNTTWTPSPYTLVDKTYPSGYPIAVQVDERGVSAVESKDCSHHCSKQIDKPRECFRYAEEMPPWNSTWDDEKKTPVYESYACLVCLNVPAMAASPNHPEFGNTQREIQDLVDEIYVISTEVGIPPQLAFAMALQESMGSVRPHSGDQGASKGTFQVQIPGAVTCFGSPIGKCPTEMIKQMVSLGICGQLSCQKPYQRPGISTYWAQNPGNIGLITRGYNSGSVYDPHDLTAIQFGTNSYSSDIVNRMMGRVVAGFFSRTCCAKCDEGRKILEVNTCGPVDGSMSDFCGDDQYSFHGSIG
jgi:hypothetical protein